MRVYRVLQDHPQSTSFEIDTYMGVKFEVAHRRLPELEKIGLAKRCTFEGKLFLRECQIRGTVCQLWEAV